MKRLLLGLVLGGLLLLAALTAGPGRRVQALQAALDQPVPPPNSAGAAWWGCGEKPQIGDVNEDRQITIADAVLVERAALGLVALNRDQTMLADGNGDGRVTIADALLILNHVIGKP